MKAKFARQLTEHYKDPNNIIEILEAIKMSSKLGFGNTIIELNPFKLKRNLKIKDKLEELGYNVDSDTQGLLYIYW